MSKQTTLATLEIKRGTGINLIFNSMLVSYQTSLLNEDALVRLIIKEQKNFDKFSDHDALINKTMSTVISSDNNFLFNLSPEDTIKLDAKKKYYLAVQLSIKSKKLSNEVVYSLNVLDSLVKSFY